MANTKRETLLKSQQGELDAVQMYLALAKKAPNKTIADTFKQLAQEEGHHANVFFQLTNEKLSPKNTKAVLLPILKIFIGWKNLLKIMAKGEYKAFNKYESVVADYESVASVRQDEKRHGDTLLALIPTLK